MDNNLSNERYTEPPEVSKERQQAQDGTIETSGLYANQSGEGLNSYANIIVPETNLASYQNTPRPSLESSLVARRPTVKSENDVSEQKQSDGVDVPLQTGVEFGYGMAPEPAEHEESPSTKQRKMLFEIDDVPSWYLTIFLGFQHYLMMAGATLSIPLVIMPAMCMKKDDPEMGNIISTYLFVSGIVTILQSTFGIRLPIIQGGSFAFMATTLSILNDDKWNCNKDDSPEGLEPKWKSRMNEIQGAIIMASFFQMFLGFFGIFGQIMHHITPITLASAVVTIGLSLLGATTSFTAKDWPISILTIVLIILFSQYLRHVKVSIPFTINEKKTGPVRYPMFQLFPVLLAIVVVWALCGILTASGVYKSGHASNTAEKWNIVSNSWWFRVPYPFQWGWPTFSVSAGVGFLSAVFAGIVESLGEYRAISRIVNAKPPQKHAINRGVFMEGVGCFLMGIFGSGNGTTSYSENTGALSITRVGSRRVIQMAGLLMMIFSLVSKIGAFFMSLPDPIIGGTLCVTFAMIVAVGMSNLQNVDLTSNRNIFIVGFSVFFGLAISQWMQVEANASLIYTGINDKLDETIRVILRTGMFVAALLSFFLDNTIPGTDAERGIKRKVPGEEEEADTTYDLPFGMDFLTRFKDWTSLFPISPTFEGYSQWRHARRMRKNRAELASTFPMT